MRKRSIKNTRVNTEVQRELSEIIRRGLKDPRVAPWTSVVAVEVAPDLKTCKAYISVLGDVKAQEDTIKGLRSAEGFIRRELARTLNMRNTPEIQFILDPVTKLLINDRFIYQIEIVIQIIAQFLQSVDIRTDIFDKIRRICFFRLA